MKSSISQPEYEIMGVRVACVEIQVARTFKLESDLDNYLAKQSRKLGWKYSKVDTYNQIGFPDALFLKEDKYWTVESKLLKRKKLTNLLDNIRWEAGQIPWMLQALKRKQNYLLVVAKDDTLLILGDKHNVRSMLNNTNDLRLI